MALKEKLLNLDIVCDSDYLDKYIELIEANRTTKREKFKTQRHHIIPKYYYKINNLDVDDSDENIVNLLYKDHARAHYYLALCSKDTKLRLAMILALKYILFGKCSNESLIDVLDEDALENLQLFYSTMKNDLSKIMHYNKGKVAMIKDGKQYYVDFESVDEKLSLGYQRGLLISTIEKIKFTNEHKMWITNGIDDLYIDKNENIPTNFYRGRSINYFQVKKTEESEKRRRDKISVSNTGKQLSIETREKLAYIMKFGEQRTSLRKWMNNSKINKRILEKDVDSFKQLGWNLGKIGKNKCCSEERKLKIGNQNKGRQYIHKEGIMKFIKKDEIKKYLNAGWSLGYIRKER